MTKLADSQPVRPSHFFFGTILWLFSKEWVDEHSRRLLAVLLALGVCIVAAYAIGHQRPYAFSYTDDTWTTAQNLVNGNGYSDCIKSYFPFCGPTNQQTAMREPVPVILMAAAMSISASPLSGLAIQSLLYLGTLLVIYELVKPFDRRAALLAALLWLTSIPVIRSLGSDSGSLSAAFFLSVGMLFFQKGRANKKIRYWIFCGLFLGLASLSRSIVTGLAVGLMLGLLWERRTKRKHSWREWVGPTLLILCMFCAVVAPWVVRNDVVFGRPVIGSTLVGYNIFRMNQILQSANFVPRYVGPSESNLVVAKLIQQGGLTGNENEAQMQAFYMNAGLRIILSNPLKYLFLAAFRFLPLWFNVSVNAAYGDSIGMVDVVIAAQQAVLLIAGLAGAFVNRKTHWPFILCLVLACGAYMAIDAQLRYMVDVMPLVVIMAASILPALIRFAGTHWQTLPVDDGKQAHTLARP